MLFRSTLFPYTTLFRSLVFASGPGSASRQGIGTGVFFGMLVAISVGIVFVPFFFVWVYRIKDKFKRVSHEKR